MFATHRRCGARTRKGEPCRAIAYANGRCRVHGGPNDGGKPGNKNAIKHGLYANAITSDEEAYWVDVKLGTVDDEIRLAKIQLARVAQLQLRAETSPDELIGMEVTRTEARSQSGEGGKAKGAVVSRVKSRPDYRRLVLQWLHRISELEARRADLLAKRLTTPAIDPTAAAMPGSDKTAAQRRRDVEMELIAIMDKTAAAIAAEEAAGDA